MPATLPRFGSATPIEPIVTALHEHGGIIVENVLDRDLLDPIELLAAGTP